MRTKNGRDLTDGTRRNQRSGERDPRGRGQAIAEFALVLPVMLLIMAGIIDFGFAMYTRITVINAAGDGARAASLQKTHSQIASTATTAVSSAISGAGLSGGTATVRCIKGTDDGDPISCSDVDASEDSVIVIVSYSYHSIFASLFGTTIPLGSTAQMVIQR